jgi:hypothetical protein
MDEADTDPILDNGPLGIQDTELPDIVHHINWNNFHRTQSIVNNENVNEDATLYNNDDNGRDIFLHVSLKHDFVKNILK